MHTGTSTHAVPLLPRAAQDDPVLVPAQELPAGVLIVAEPPVKVGKSVIVDEAEDDELVIVDVSLMVLVPLSLELALELALELLDAILESTSSGKEKVG